MHELCKNDSDESILEFNNNIHRLPDINIYHKGKTLLYSACYHGNLKIVKILLFLDANPNILSFGETNLYIAIWRSDINEKKKQNYIDIIFELTTSKKDVEITPKQDVEKKEKIEKYKIDIDQTNLYTFFSPLCYGIIKDNAEIVRILIANYANVNYSVYNKNTRPLHLACQKRNFNIIKNLIDSGAKIYTLDDQFKNPMYYIFNNSYSMEKEATSELLELVKTRGLITIDKYTTTKIPEPKSKLNPRAMEWLGNK